MLFLEIPSTESQDEKELLCIQRVLAGETDAFRDIILAYEVRLRSFCRARLPESEVDDAMQDIFIKTFRSLKTFRQGNSFPAWFFTIAHSTIATKKLKFKRDLDRKERAILFAEDIPPENEGQKHLEAEMIRGAVSALPPANRKVVELYYFAELDVEQTAKVLRKTEAYVKTRLFRSRKELYKILGAT
jgi:RNA polymerase sigma-70 factor (ECF subfamily)